VGRGGVNPNFLSNFYKNRLPFKYKEEKKIRSRIPNQGKLFDSDGAGEAGRVEKVSRTVFIYLHGIGFFEKLRKKIKRISDTVRR
jgi:hypothetical protein